MRCAAEQSLWIITHCCYWLFSVSGAQVLSIRCLDKKHFWAPFPDESAPRVSRPCLTNLNECCNQATWSLCSTKPSCKPKANLNTTGDVRNEPWSEQPKTTFCSWVLQKVVFFRFVRKYDWHHSAGTIKKKTLWSQSYFFFLEQKSFTGFCFCLLCSFNEE